MKISNITICAVDCITPHLAARALEISTQKIQFGESILLTNTAVVGSFKTQIINPISSFDQYSEFMIKKLGQYIKTSHVLIVQWDGYITNPEAWNEDFLSYDYIGAKWPWQSDGHNIGNGGFSLRSKKLLDLLSSNKFQLPVGMNEDEFISRHARKSLEKKGIKFAPEAIADLFSYEFSTPQNKTFGFHGFRNMWRHITDNEMIKFFEELPVSVLKTQSSADLLLQYFILKKETPLLHLYIRMKQLLSVKEIYESIKKSINLDTDKSAECIVECEKLLSKFRGKESFLKINLSLEPEEIPSYMNIITSPQALKPWPLPDHSVEEILAINFLTHFPDNPDYFSFFLSEVKRISIEGAKIFIHIPYEKSWNKEIDQFTKSNLNFIVEKSETVSTQVLPAQLKSHLATFGDLNFAINKYIDTKIYWDIILCVK